MGLVIRFPLEQRIAQGSAPPSQGGNLAEVVILPVVRIDRHKPTDDLAPGTGSRPSRGGRRRAGRS